MAGLAGSARRVRCGAGLPAGRCLCQRARAAERALASWPARDRERRAVAGAAVDRRGGRGCAGQWLGHHAHDHALPARRPPARQPAAQPHRHGHAGAAGAGAGAADVRGLLRRPFCRGGQPADAHAGQHQPDRARGRGDPEPHAHGGGRGLVAVWSLHGGGGAHGRGAGRRAPRGGAGLRPGGALAAAALRALVPRARRAAAHHGRGDHRQRHEPQRAGFAAAPLRAGRRAVRPGLPGCSRPA